MIFNSYIFILAFLPVTLLGYFCLNKKRTELGLYYLLLMSFIFVAFASKYYLFWLFFSICINFFIVKMFEKKEDSSKRSKNMILFAGIFFNVGLLLYFKYSNFFIDSINNVFNLKFNEKNIILPLGISFYTFSQIAFLVDSYRKEITNVKFLDYALFISYFPKFGQGPIVLHEDLLYKFRDKTRKEVNWDNIAKGIQMFVRGLAKKVLLADRFGKAVDYCFANTGSMSRMDVVVLIISYSFQIYFDFSGYCDMANGVSIMFNMELPINFNSPYKALTITDFWKRWHISLTGFLRKYLYFPLGGNRKGKVRTYLNMIIVFTISGLWHGAGMNFVLWGFMHGVCQILHRITGKVFDKLFKPVQWIITFCFVSIAWLLFRSNAVYRWKHFMDRMIFPQTIPLQSDLAACFKIDGLRSIASAFKIPYTDRGIYIACMVAFLVIGFVLCLVPENNQKREYYFNKKTFIMTFALFIICILSLSQVTSFLYFNF